MATGDVYKVTWEFQDTDAGGPFMSSGFHVQQVGVEFDADRCMEIAYDAWDAGISGSDPLKEHYAPTLSLTAITVRRIDPLEPTIQSYGGAFPVAGTDTGNGLPPNSSVIVSLRTENIGRSYRGRMYLPPSSEADTSGNLVEADAISIATTITAMFTQYVGEPPLTRLEGVVWSRKLELATPITDVMVDRRLRVQRRRQPQPAYVTGS